MVWTKQNPIRVATHSCPQHLDELIAISLLRRWAEARGTAMEVHFLTRQEILRQSSWFDVLIDIGQQFDVARGRFDHHQDLAAVAGRSSAGLVFDALYADDPRRAYLEPIIRHVDAIDVGVSRPPLSPETRNRGPSMVSVPALLKAVGGFEHDPAASRRCLELIGSLVDSWFRQADALGRAAEVVAAAQCVGAGIFLATDEAYGPGLLEFLQQETDLAFVGFPTGPDRFQVVAIRGADGHNRVTFPASLAGATFVHPQGFLAVFADRDSARRVFGEAASAPRHHDNG
jgi:uncharacterized UPF0160 family protein